MKVAIDTNILVYAEGANDSERREIVLAAMQPLARESVVIPAQVLGELFNVLVRKTGRTPVAARDTVLRWHDLYEALPTTPDVLRTAMDIATEHQLRIWDAVILAAASSAGCRLLLSEVLQDGFTWGGVTVVSPFTDPRHWLLASLLAQGSPGR